MLSLTKKIDKLQAAGYYDTRVVYHLGCARFGNMIEAVNSVLSNAPYTKAVVEQQSVARSFAANPARVQEASIRAPYISLYIKMDTNFDKAILQIRDSDTGDVVRQIPTESQLEAYRRAQTSNAVRPPVAEPETRVDSYDDAPEFEATPQASYTAAPSTPTPNAPAAAPATPAATTTTAAPAPSAPQPSIDTEA